MPLAVSALPRATPLDPAEEPPGSIDPLGTLAHAERLAELLLPGLTARMWRARLLTFAAVAAAVADRALAHLDGREDARLDARLAFERLAVSAIVRLAASNPAEDRAAHRRLPGSDLARAALAAGEPLTRHNFLKGEAVNGPCGVMSRLALQLGVVDEDGHLGQHGPSLLLAWAEDRGLAGILDERGEGRRPGAVWADEVARHVARWVSGGQWPPAGSALWQRLADNLRLDQIGPEEGRVLVTLLEQGPVRGRVLHILRDRPDVYRQRVRDGRGTVEREVLLQAVRPSLGNDPADRVIRVANFAIHVYETAAVRMQEAFDGALWGLRQLGGSAAPAKLFAQPGLRRSLERARAALQTGLRALDEAVSRLQGLTELNRPDLIGPIVRLREDAADAAASPAALLDTLARRHERVQREKRKGPWIDRERSWVLLPGFGVGGDLPPEYGPVYIHPFRVVNVYSLLTDLGELPPEDSDGEE
jgi:hypothetical protein